MDGIPYILQCSAPSPGPPSNTGFLQLTQLHNPNGISTGSAVIAALTIVTERQTEKQTIIGYSVCNNRPHLRTILTDHCVVTVRILLPVLNSV